VLSIIWLLEFLILSNRMGGDKAWKGDNWWWACGEKKRENLPGER
jgi:hypothetical protein